MALFTTKRENSAYAIARLQNQTINYVVQEAGNNNINIYFGADECIETVKMLVKKPLNELTAEEDFMLGAMLGYDICVQCRRYCERKYINR